MSIPISTRPAPGTSACCGGRTRSSTPASSSRGKLSDLLADLDDGRPVVAVAEGIPEERLIDVGRGAFDPHVWFSVPLWEEAAAAAVEGLIAADPAGAQEYRARLADYLAELP